MARKTSKKKQSVDAQNSSPWDTLKGARPSLRSRVKLFWAKKHRNKSKKFFGASPHRSFRRSYREDYKRELKVPSITYHVFQSFRILIKNWRLFLPFLVIVFLLNIVFVGLMDESRYVEYQDVLDQTSEQVSGGDIGNLGRAGLLLISTVTTGGLSGESSEAAMVFSALIFLLIWLVTIFVLRHRLAGHTIKLRDGLYNAMTPLVSTLLVLLVVLFQCIPIFVLLIAYSAALQTEFLTMPFYALVFFIFAVLMILISGYLLSSSLMALVAVSAPGLYPMQALRTASELMMGRRVRLILRLIVLIFVIALLWVIVMFPVILFDLFMKQFEWTSGIPFVPICLTIMTSFSFIYATTYLYLYYRWMLNYEEA